LIVVGKECLEFAGCRMKEAISLDSQAGPHQDVEIIGQEIDRDLEHLGGLVLVQRVLPSRGSRKEEIRRVRLLSRDGEDEVSFLKRLDELLLGKPPAQGPWGERVGRIHGFLLVWARVSMIASS
jgi:hypothetical protein